MSFEQEQGAPPTERKVNLSLVLGTQEMMELERMALDRDAAAALEFVTERIVKPVRQTLAAR